MAKKFRKTVYGWDVPRHLECGGCGRSVPVNKRESEDTPEGSILFARCDRCDVRVVTFAGYPWWIEAVSAEFCRTMEDFHPGFATSSRTLQLN